MPLNGSRGELSHYLMQFLSPIPLVFVLWLFATAVPAATVLLNGSMVPLSMVRADEEYCRPAAAPDDRSDAVQGRTVIRTVGCLPIFAEREPAGLPVVGEIRAVTPSLLHTALQRHRPKVA